MPKHEVSDTGTFRYLVSTWVIRDIRSLYSVLVRQSRSSSSCPGSPVSTYAVLVVSRSSCLHLCIPGWCRRGMGLGDAPIGNAAGDYLTGIPALGEVPRHGRLLVYLLWGRPSFLPRRRPDQCPPSTYHPIDVKWSCWPKELHSPPPKKIKRSDIGSRKSIHEK